MRDHLRLDEMEPVDSETGDWIAAMVNKSNLGAGAEVGAEYFSRDQRFAAARKAFDQGSEGTAITRFGTHVDR